MISVPVVKSQFKTVENGASGWRKMNRVEVLVWIQWYRGSSCHRAITVDEGETFHIIERVALLYTHQKLSVPSEVLKLSVDQPYPSHLITLNKIQSYKVCKILKIKMEKF